MFKYGIIAAQLEEAIPTIKDLYLKRLSDTIYLNEDKGIILMISGVSMLNAYSSTVSLLSTFNLDYVVNIGVVAGRGELSVGDVVTVDRAYNGDMDLTGFGHSLYSVPGIGDYLESIYETEALDLEIPAVDCFSVSYFSDSSIAIGDYVVDMEYYGILLACNQWRVPCLAIKCVSDTLESEDSIEEYNSNLDSSSHKLVESIRYFINSKKPTLKLRR